VPDSPRSTIVIWLLAAALAVVAVVKLLGGEESPATPVRADAPAARGVSSPTADAHTVYVHVAGAVHKPGLVELPAGTRVATALARVGGPTRKADLTLVNLAARVQDGQQILVPAAGAPAPGAAGSAAGGAAGAGGVAGSGAGGAAGSIPGVKIHLSTATIEQLDGIGGIGPTLAERIVEYRDAHGGFRSIEELAEVEGIGEKRLATLREALQP
jgi:competence protein ComEA